MTELIDLLSDFVAYPIIGMLSLFDHVVTFGGVEVSNETLDQLDQQNAPDMVARWRYRMNHAFGGSRTYEYYAAQPHQELLSCGCGCGCGLLLMALLTGLFVLFLLLCL